MVTGNVYTALKLPSEAAVYDSKLSLISLWSKYNERGSFGKKFSAVTVTAAFPSSMSTRTLAIGAVTVMSAVFVTAIFSKANSIL